MALKKSQLGDICELSSVAETAVQCLLSAERFCLPNDPDCLGLWGWGGRWAALALQHVVVALLVIVISVVIEIRTVIGSRYQGEGPVVVFGVQWFLLNADVMPGGEGEEEKNLQSAILNFPPYSFPTFHTIGPRVIRAVPILFRKEKAGEQKQMSGFSEAVSGSLTGTVDNFSFLLRYSNPGKAAGFLFSWQPTTGYSLRIDKWGRLTTWDEQRREWTLRSEWGCRCQPPGGGGSAARCVFLFLLVNMHNLRGGSPEDDPEPASIINQLQANTATRHHHTCFKLQN